VPADRWNANRLFDAPAGGCAWPFGVPEEKDFAQRNLQYRPTARFSLRILSGLALLAFEFFGTVSTVNGDALGGASFTWDAVGDPSVSGYNVYWGTQSGVYDTRLDAANVTQVIISGFVEGVEYFSAVTSYSDTGEESDYSTEIAFIVMPAGGATTPVITTQPTATAITFGQTLASSALSGGAALVPGAFAFTVPVTAPAVGTASLRVTFSPWPWNCEEGLRVEPTSDLNPQITQDFFIS